MNYTKRTQGTLFRALSLLLALFFSGCAIVEQEPAITPEVEEIVVEPAPAPEPAPTPKAVIPPAQTIPVVRESKLLGPRVAIVLSDRKPAYENVATELGELLENYLTYDLTDKSLTPREVFASIAEIDAEIVIAIGLRAAIVANSFSEVPVVFCQVFNVADNDITSANLKGVAALPPLDLQVEAWKSLNPNLKNVGAILGSGHDDLIEEATEAADSAGLTLHYRIANSDREALYLFNRLTPSIDGFWLFPDNRVLSPLVLRQMLSYASRHRVQVAVFNPSLLDLGATLSATTVYSDIAATVVSVTRRVINGDIESIPAVTPLTEINVQANPAIIKEIKLATADAPAGKSREDAQ